MSRVRAPFPAPYGQTGVWNPISGSGPWGTLPGDSDNALSQEVERAIRRSIQEAVYKPGEKIPSERELGETFEVSRVTVREALRRLEQGGLIAIRRGVRAGAYVTEPSAAPITENFRHLVRLGHVDYGHLIDARLYIEPRSAEIAARERTTADLRRIGGLLDQAEAEADASWTGARIINVSFHCEVARITRNPIVVFITESIIRSFSTLIIESTGARLGRGDIQKFIDEHREILAAIRRRDADAARETTRRHLLETYTTYARVAPEGLASDIDRRIRKEG